MAIYSFLWDEYADWYIEISKKRIGAGGASAMEARRTLVYVLDSCLRLLHPFMPYVTEELWQRIPHAGPSLMVAQWPQLDDTPLPTDARAEGEFSSLQSLVRSVRNARAEYRVEPGKLIAATVVAGEEPLRMLQAEGEAIAMLARIAPSQLEFALPSDPQPEEGVVRLVADESVEAVLPLKEMVNAAKERARLGKQQVTPWPPQKKVFLASTLCPCRLPVQPTCLGTWCRYLVRIYVSCQPGLGA